MRLKAFTLIELLIVVAIIAILAAIAVPNFLEAQVRSKVSRVKADLRSIATAIEAYAVDSNKYPIKVGPGNGPPAGITVPANSVLGSWVPQTLADHASITTPIAYMTTVPRDVFFLNSPNGPDVPISHPIKSFRYIRNVLPPIPANVSANNFGSDSDGSIGVGGVGTIPTRLDRWGAWYMISFGPDLDADATSIDNRYDPTNGTIANGDIYYTQKNNFEN